MNKETETTPPAPPLYFLDILAAQHEQREHRLTVIITALIFALAATNIAWLIYTH